MLDLLLGRQMPDAEKRRRAARTLSGGQRQILAMAMALTVAPQFLLLERGAYPNVEIESSADTLSAALARQNGPMIELLCSHGAARAMHLLGYYGDLQTAAAVVAANPAMADDPVALELFQARREDVRADARQSRLEVGEALQLLAGRDIPQARGAVVAGGEQLAPG